jgi:hypothetical protein
MTVPLPMAPHPYPDELISSWVERVACRYGMSRAAPVGSHPSLPSLSGAGRLDWQADPADLAALGEACRLDPDLLRRLDLAEISPGWPRHWFSWDGYEPEPWGEIAPAFCRRCLRDDAAAGRDTYLRRAWARALGMCQTHQEPLTRSCGWCGAECEPGRRWRLELHRNAARHVCPRCAHFADQQPSPGWVDDPSDPLWPYVREPIAPQIGELIAEAWREVTRFEAVIIAALGDPPSPPLSLECAEAAGFARAVEDLAVLFCRPIATDGSRALLDGRGTEAFPLPSGRFRGMARSDTPLAFLAPAERQAVIAAIADLLHPPRGAHEAPPLGCRAVLETAWRFDFEQLVRLLDRESLLWLRTRVGAWPEALQQRVHSALPQGKPQRAPSAGFRGAAGLRRLRGREEARYRLLAEAILASEAWRASRGQPAARRRRLLGRLMRRALELEISADLGQNSRELG